jgi:hypothetical protein|tara:strand:+ start:6047 stop:6553 length:507 start_codon:yes stop_codon:yes gene_type:complete
MSVVRVTNLRDVVLVDSFDGTTYSVDPKGTAIVPLEAAKLWFGNWDTFNKPERALRERDDEYKRLLIRYGSGDNPALWEETKPLVTVTDVDGNDPVTTVIDDPTGTSVSHADVTVDEHQDMLSMIRQQAKDLDRLKKQYATQIRSDQPDADADEDSPEPVASKRAKRQ